MEVFTVIGIITTVLLACAALGGLMLLVTARIRGLGIRKYVIVDGLAADDENARLGNAFTFRGAKRIAFRTPGSRIYDRYGGSFRVADSGWYERRNGFPGYFVSVCDAAKMLGIEPSSEPGPEKYSAARQILDEAHVQVDWGDGGGVEYKASDVLKLAGNRERALAVFAD